MTSISNQIRKIELELSGVAKLIAVSKKQPEAKLMEAYDSGFRRFGENYVQELVTKAESLPKDIEWHMIGHLQSNKVKFIAPFITLIHSVDSLKLLKEINKQALKNNRIIDCLLQVQIAEEETKTGFDVQGLHQVLNNDFSSMKNVRILGLMGMSTFTSDEKVITQ
jgi:pyridoxal phosphate enzyme (YggS family)